MLYYLADMLEPWFGPLNVLTYHTVRAGGAAVTGFLLCLLFGPAIIRRLRDLKIGQYIKRTTSQTSTPCTRERPEHPPWAAS